MLWLMILAIWTVAVALIVARFVDARGTNSDVHLPSDVGVTLSVLPNRTAVVTLELGTDACAASVAPLVELAVKEALAFTTVDVVEVRYRDGQLIDRRSRGDELLARNTAPRHSRSDL